MSQSVFVKGRSLHANVSRRTVFDVSAFNETGSPS